MPDSSLRIRKLVFNSPGTEKDGAWLNFNDLRRYMGVCAEGHPEDAKTLEKLDRALVSGSIHMEEI